VSSQRTPEPGPGSGTGRGGCWSFSSWSTIESGSGSSPGIKKTCSFVRYTFRGSLSAKSIMLFGFSIGRRRGVSHQVARRVIISVIIIIIKI